MQFDVG